MAESENCVLKLEADDVGCLACEFLSCWCGGNRRCQHEPLEGTKPYAISEADEIKVPEYVAFALVYGVTKTVSEKRVACEPLSFLNQEPKSERGG